MHCPRSERAQKCTADYRRHADGLRAAPALAGYLAPARGRGDLQHVGARRLARPLVSPHLARQTPSLPLAAGSGAGALWRKQRRRAPAEHLCGHGDDSVGGRGCTPPLGSARWCCGRRGGRVALCTEPLCHCLFAHRLHRHAARLFGHAGAGAGAGRPLAGRGRGAWRGHYDQAAGAALPAADWQRCHL